MKFKLILIFILLAVSINTWAASPYVLGVAGNQSTGSSGSYTDILYHWGADSTTAEKSAGDSTATLNSDAVIDTAVKQVGTGSLDCPGAFDYAEFTVSSADIVDHLSGRVGFYAYIDTAVNNQYLFQCTYDADNRITFARISGTWKMDYRGSSSGTNTYVNTSWSPSTSTWYYVELVWGGPTYTLQVLVDGVDAGNTTSSLPVMTNAPTTLTWGVGVGVAADIHMDQMISSDDPTRDLNAVKSVTDFSD